MKPLTIIRHIECEGPGYLESILRQRRINFRLIALDRGESLPAAIHDTSGLVIMGGPMSVNDDEEWITQEISLVNQAIAADLPVLGHCLGGQMIARALGAAVISNPVKEIGWLPVQAQEIPPGAPSWLADFRNPQNVFHWHGETFKIPAGANRLLSSQHCDNQAFLYKDNVYAFQCHIEMTCEMVDEWSALYAEEINIPSETIQERETMLGICRSNIDNMNQLASKIYADWLSKLGNLST
jgi:GMP synthase-like glutamine amidotransferase